VQQRNPAGHEIRSPAVPDVDELLGIAFGKREPGALHLHHDAVSGAEGMGDVRHPERHPRRNTGRKRLGTRETAAIAAAHDVAPHEHPVARQRIVLGEKVDQLDHEIGIGRRKRHFQVGIDRAD